MSEVQRFDSAPFDSTMDLDDSGEYVLYEDFDRVTAEPANILWHEDQPWFIEDGSIARAALKSAEGGGDE